MYSSTVANIGGQFDIRSANELVDASRLNIIDQSLKSFGSLIDNRQLFTLDDTPKPNKKIASTAEGKSFSNFLQNQSQSTSKVFDDIISVNTKYTNLSNYANEELIWTSKSNDKKYFQKRAYEDPALQKFRDNLTVVQKKRNKELTLKALHTLADNYRNEMTIMKEEMNNDGIFHEEANAHRVHCIYLMRLYKGISAQSIEDPVLRQLRSEEVLKMESDAAEEARKHLLIRIATIGREEAEKEVAFKKALNSTLLSPSVSLLRMSTKLNSHTLSKITNSLNKHDGPEDTFIVSSLAGTRKNTLQEKESRRGSKIEGRKQSRDVLGQGPVLPVNIISSNNNSISSNNNIPIPETVTFTTVTTVTTKVPRERGRDAYRDREDEYESECASTTPSQRQSSKWEYETQETNLATGSNIATASPIIPHVDKMMFNRIRQRRLGAIDARTLMPEEATKLENADIISSKKQKHRGALINNENTVWILQRLQEQHQNTTKEDSTGSEMNRIIPFDEFERMFEKCQNNAEQRMIDRIDDHQHYLGNSNSSATMKGTWHVPTPGSLPPSKGPAPPTLPLGDKYEENDEGYVNKMTVVQQLAKDDPLFDSYLKMTLRDRPAGRRLMKSTAASFLKPKVKRIRTPLGRLAVILEAMPSSSSEQMSGSIGNINGMHQKGSLSSSSLATMGVTQIDPPINQHGYTNTGYGIKFEEKEPSVGKGYSSYMASTKQGIGIERGHVGNKIPKQGFINFFQNNNPPDMSISMMESLDSEFDGSVNAYRDRRIASPGPNASRSVMDGFGYESDAMTVKSSPTRTAAQRRRHERERESYSSDYDSKSSKGVETETQASAMQRKLVQVWDCLQVSASERLDFMRKFSLYPYSLKLGLATDLWGEAAVLVVVRYEILKLLGALKSGLRRLPLRASEVIDIMLTAVPADLASRSSAFLPLPFPSSSSPAKPSSSFLMSLDNRGGREKDNEEGSEGYDSLDGLSTRTPPSLPVPLSAIMLASMITFITKTFEKSQASESQNSSTNTSASNTARRGSTMQNKGKKETSLDSMIAVGNSQGEEFAKKLAAAVSSQKNENDNEIGRTKGIRKSMNVLHKMKSIKNVNSAPNSCLDYKETEKVLLIKTEREAEKCLLLLRKIADQNLLISLRNTLEQINDVVTYGKMSVQEWISLSI